MPKTNLIEQHRDDIAALCRWGVSEVHLGPLLRSVETLLAQP